MSDFKIPLQISGTLEELNILQEELIKLGYRFDNTIREREGLKLLTGFRSEHDLIAYQMTGAYPRRAVNASEGKDYILALAALREGDEFYPGEIVATVEIESDAPWKAGTLARVTNNSESWLHIEWLPRQEDKRGEPLTQQNGGYYHRSFRKATIEEIQEYYHKTPKSKDMADTEGKLPIEGQVFQSVAEPQIQHAQDSQGNIVKPGDWITPIKAAGNHTTHPAHRVNYAMGDKLLVEEVVKTNYTHTTYAFICKGGYVVYADSVQKTEGPKVIGYKAPFSLFGGRINKGDIFSEYREDRFVMYNSKHMTSGVATEIVQSWEPVYESPFKLGDWVYIINGGPGAFGINGAVGVITNKPSTDGLRGNDEGINIQVNNHVWRVQPYAELRKATKQEIDKVTKITLLGYDADYHTPGAVKFGCQTFGQQEVEVLLKFLSRNDISPAITIGKGSEKTPITKELLTTILQGLV